MTNNLLSLVILFGSLSLVSIGGGNTVIPDIQRAAVLMHHWMTDAEFAAAFAIARAAPGPGSLIVALVGWKAAGWPGAVLATAAMYIPAALLAWFVGRIWQRFHDNPWLIIIENALAPITLALIFASGWIIARQVSHGLLACILGLGTVWLVAKTKISPLWIMLFAALAGIFGLC